MIVVFVVLAGLALFGVFGFALLGSVDKGQKKAYENAAQILDDAFDGRENVVFKIHMQTLKYEDIILGAKERGYRVANDATQNWYGTVIFEKINPVS